MADIVEKFKNTIHAWKMVCPGDKIVVAVSGGPDSMALLHILSQLKDEFKIHLAIAHMNHSARGKESDEDALFVSQLGASLGIDTLIEKIDVKQEKSELKTSFQNAARTVRYRFLDSVLEKTGGTKVAMGHTADDQVETVLMNLIRGSGMTGLSGMPAVRFPYIRPLLNCCREEVLEYLDSHKLDYRCDSSNEKTDYLRNRVRLELIPALEKNYNSNFKQNILETSAILRDENSFLTQLVDEQFSKKYISQQEGEEVEVDSRGLLELPIAIQRRLIRKAIFFAKGDLKKITSAHVQDVLNLMKTRQSGKRINLPDNLAARYHNGLVIFFRNPGDDSSIPTKEGIVDDVVTLNIPGETGLEGMSLVFKTQLLGQKDKDWTNCTVNQAYFDFDKTGSIILTRFIRPGDRFIPLGMTGSKKLKSYFIDQKIPREERKSIPVFTTQSDDIIWVYGHRISNVYKVTGSTRKVLYIEGFQ